MCYELDVYFKKALLAEQLRMKQARNEAAKNDERRSPASAQTTQTERQDAPRERVPA